MSDTIRVERMPPLLPLVVAVVVFPIAFVIVGLFASQFVRAFTSSLFPVALSTIVLSVPPAYFMSRSIYRAMRWDTIDNSDRRYCGNCTYDLTGNVSGRCPECGLEVGRAAPPQEVPENHVDRETG